MATTPWQTLKTLFTAWLNTPNTVWAGFWRWFVAGAIYIVVLLVFVSTSLSGFAVLGIPPLVALIRLASFVSVVRQKESAAKGEILAYVSNILLTVVLTIASLYVMGGGGYAQGMGLILFGFVGLAFAGLPGWMLLPMLLID